MGEGYITVPSCSKTNGHLFDPLLDVSYLQARDNIVFIISDMAQSVRSAGGEFAGAAADASAERDSSDPDMVQIWRFIYFDMSFAKSLYGILVAAELVSVLFFISQIPLRLT